MHRPVIRPRRPLILLVSALLIAASLGFAATAPAAPAAQAKPATAPVASGWTLIKFPGGQPACTGVGFLGAIYYDRLDCGFGYVSVSGTTATSVVKVTTIGVDGSTLGTETSTYRAEDDAWEFSITPGTTWPAGPVTIRVSYVDGATGDFGDTEIILNALGATVGVTGSGHTPGAPANVAGTIFELDQVPPLAAAQKKGVGAAFSLRVVRPDGTASAPIGPFTAASDGTFSATIPGSATAGLTATADSDFTVTVSIEVVDATYTDPLTGGWAAERAGAGALALRVPPTGLTLDNSFVSSVGWVKPGDAYPSRLVVRNYTSAAVASVSVNAPAVSGMAWTKAAAAGAGSGTCALAGGAVSWTIPSVPAATTAGPGIATCVLEAKAKTTGQDAQVVWKDISSTATLTAATSPTRTAKSHGPKVIPPDPTYDTARYGDRPFPVVPVDYNDRSHETAHTGESLANKINSPGVSGSTFNLYQEMSYGQLYPHGDVPSAEIASAGWTGYGPGFQFTQTAPAGTCHGATYADVPGVIGSPLYPERIRDGWYQLPGSTDYYGDDKTGTAIVGSVAGVGALQDIDSACGPTGKAVYDAAQVADPEIDYSDFDTDKDGVVDFFMMVFAGVGGHGASQTSVPPYDNIWPHSSSLEFTYSSPDGKGYVSDDQLKDLQGRPLFWTSSARTQMTTTSTAWKVFVRVGPYNVNPENAIDKASVISHEYGHSLGLPDFYSTGSRTTYGTWTLMGEDHSQNMDVFGKQELGWLVPRVLKPGATTAVSGWQDSKLNTHRIDWVDRNGNPYTLTGAGVNNGTGYVAKLPSRQIIDPAKVASGASATHVWWSQSGNDFGCAPDGGHNFDIYLPELASVPSGTTVTASFKSLWNIEWDYDYGFVMASTDGGATYQSLPSANGYTTATGTNPNNNGCQGQYGNGLTGASGSYAAGTQTVDRLTSAYPDGGFLADSYDLSAFAGHATVLRFSYATDPGLAKQGWFVDDLKVTAGSNTIYSTDFEAGADDARVYNGGCQGTTGVATQCTHGWQYVDSSSGSPADHAYYMEMRDRSSFDLDGKGEDDRGNGATWAPGLLLTYTDEAHGYGNFGTDDPPAQSPLDSNPQPQEGSPNLDDAAFTAAAGKNSYSDFGAGHVDNYDSDPSTNTADWVFAYDCLSFHVDSMSGATNGPATVPPYDLTGNVTFTLGSGCGAFDYGYGATLPNQAPTAVADARPTSVAAGTPVAFDGSGSYDDRQAASELSYSWNFGDGSAAATGQSPSHTYTTAGTYTATLTVKDADGLTDTDTVAITVTGTVSKVDLLITKTDAGEAGKTNGAKEGSKVTLKAWVKNVGTAPAAASSTSFVLDGQPLPGSPVATPAIGVGKTVEVKLTWNTTGAGGAHSLVITVDSAEVVAEKDETNNSATLALKVKPNQVQNGSFEQADSSGSAPAGWTGSNTAAGTSSWSSSGTDGSKGATLTGTGGNAVLAGSPTWTSDPVTVAAGQALTFVMSVNAPDASSTAGVKLVYLGAAGQVLSTMPLTGVPALTTGFQAIEVPVTVPASVTGVRIVLSGFAPTDTHTAGSVTFDDVGLFDQ